MNNGRDVIRAVRGAQTALPSFNIPYLPMMEPVVRAVVDQDSLALVETAQVEWQYFESQGPAAVMEEFQKWQKSGHVRLHLDHVPLFGDNPDASSIIRQAIDLGYYSVMADASALDLEGNIRATRQVAEMAHAKGVFCEAQLGESWGYEEDAPPPYEEMFRERRGFSPIDPAKRFVEASGCDWLSGTFGNLHGAVTGAQEGRAKIRARLDIEHLDRLAEAVSIPFVLHGGSGIRREYVEAAIERGVAKINIGAEIRTPYRATLAEGGSVSAAQDVVYEIATRIIRDELGNAGLRERVACEASG